MIPRHILRSIERKCNALTCPECGGRHSVSLAEVAASGAFIVSFSQEACDAFQGAARNLANAEMRTFLADPLPLL